ncbi:hypothetical protein EKO27_g7312 [Xylaria grammica]|uniref:AAA+ ATPase domain-containing protein n=1 Tax=Xylaria grammica TaxID=363999 RepID=A0A439D015_9PEZI|nr:hypothetical protein EKO27_g7312 [Xylaria grammica]
MERGLKDALHTIDSIVKRGEQIEELCKQPDNDAEHEIRNLAELLASELPSLLTLRESIQTADANDPSDEESPPPSYFSIPELRFVSWAEASSLKSPPAEHATLQIPISQRVPDDPNASSERPKNIHKPADDTNKRPKEFRRAGLPPSDSHPLEELPDRIRICSQRLSIFLDFNIHDTSFNWSSQRRTPFIILRPFKFLVDRDEQIRAALADLEKVRLERFPGQSEDEYDECWEKKRPEDDLPPMAVNPAKLDQAQLTALIKDLRCLTSFMDGYIQPTMSIGQSDHIFFSDLWFVFPARSLIYTKDKEVPHKVWKVIQRTGGRRGREGVGKSRPRDHVDSTQGFSPFVIDCFHLDYDGIRYVQTYRRIKIDHFDGSQPLLSLPMIPVHVAEKAGLVDRDALIERGTEFVKLTRPSLRQYTGRNQILRPNGDKLHEKDADIPDNAARYAEWIESDVMVDFERALQEMPGWRPGVREVDLYKTKKEENSFNGVEIDSIWDGKLSEHITFEEWNKLQDWDKKRTNPTDEDDLLLLPERVFAFVFRTRKWYSDGQEMLKEKQVREEPWQDLQLPDGHKRLIQSLIESHSTEKSSRRVQYDLIRGKGKGITILLHGVPGVGKTSTAECAAEAYKRPLLPITCGDLGSSPRDVEKKLDEAFQLAQLWDCVLLLDEADIFLAQRTESDITRNALVSVFLRVLEYYEGILFLTTNRVGVFDEAFKSRIHLPLYYPPLEWKSARKIWSTYLKKLKSSSLVEVDEEEIIDYAETFFERQNKKGSKIGPVWNGRQIRNGFQSAVALAGYKSNGAKFKLEKRHFEDVSKVSNEFNHYIWSIKTQTDSDKAARWGYRFDGYQHDESIHVNVMEPVASSGPTGVSFGPQFPGPATSGMPFMNNAFQGFPQQAGFSSGSMPQASGAFPGTTNTMPNAMGPYGQPQHSGVQGFPNALANQPQ